MDKIVNVQRFVRRVVCAAVLSKESGEMVVGPRHFDAVMHRQLSRLPLRAMAEAEQGFIDQRGVFMTREEAWVVAEAAGQIVRRVGGDGRKLFSENLY